MKRERGRGGNSLTHGEASPSVLASKDEVRLELREGKTDKRMNYRIRQLLPDGIKLLFQ